MPAGITDKFKKLTPNTGWQLDASGIPDASVTSFGLVSATNLPTDTAVILTVDRVDSSGNKTPSKMERIKGIISGTTVTSCVRGVGGTAQAHSPGAVVEVVVDSVLWNDVIDGILEEHNQDGTHNAAQVAMLDGTQQFTGDKVFSGNVIAKLFTPQGFLINGKIDVSVASNNLTVALKTLAGTDPSSSNPVYCRIKDTVREISSALSVTRNAGTNWFSSGSSELATKEVDYFVYLGYNSTDGVVIGFSRIPYARQYSDFSTTTTNDKYCAISTTTNASSNDSYEVIGRFAATLSAGSSYNWSVPTFTPLNLVQRPIYETRVLSFSTTYGGFSSNPTHTCSYQISGRRIWVCYFSTAAGTSNSNTHTMTTPMRAANTSSMDIFARDNGIAQGACQAIVNSSNNTLSLSINDSGTGWTSSGNKYAKGTIIYQI